MKSRDSACTIYSLVTYASLEQCVQAWLQCDSGAALAVPY